MKFNRPLITVVYTVAALMIVVPLLEVVLSVWPLRYGQTSWRFGSIGLMSQALMTPLLGMVLLVGTAVALGHRRTLLAISVFTLLIALILLVIVPTFALDAIQMRAQVRPTAHRAFDFSALLASIKLSLTLAITLLVAVGAWKAQRQMVRRTPGGEPDMPLLAHKRSS
ncbi:MAG TPA: hypothetical protein VFO52_00980 [Longimicrobiales bacterium]|nr:hypothetical protein [Longimicrobiales bacterium]